MGIAVVRFEETKKWDQINTNLDEWYLSHLLVRQSLRLVPARFSLYPVIFKAGTVKAIAKDAQQDPSRNRWRHRNGGPALYTIIGRSPLV